MPQDTTLISASLLDTLHAYNLRADYPQAIRLTDTLLSQPLPDDLRGWVLKERAYSMIKSGYRDRGVAIYYEAFKYFGALPPERHAKYLKWAAINMVRAGYTMQAFEVMQDAEAVAINNQLSESMHSIMLCKVEVVDSLLSQNVTIPHPKQPPSPKTFTTILTTVITVILLQMWKRLAPVQHAKKALRVSFHHLNFSQEKAKNE